jgi:hypothetical protein
MIYSYVVYDTLIDLIRTDKRGLSLSIEEFNRLARVVNERVYSKYYEEFEGDTSSIDSMGGFKQLRQSVSLASGIGILPSDYWEMIGKGRYVDSSAVTRYIDLVTTLERAEREDDYLTMPTTTHPVMEIGDLDGSDNLQIRVYPSTLTTVPANTIYIDYLRTADIPFLDFYTNDTTLVHTYMAAGVNVNVPVGYTYRDGSAGAAVKASQTVNWEWSDSDFNLILAIFCQLIGITLPDQLLVETGTINEKK